MVQQLASHYSAKEIQGGTISFCDLLSSARLRLMLVSGGTLVSRINQSFDRYLLIGNRKQTVALVSRHLS